MSQLFIPHKCVGLVCDSVPPIIRYHPVHREFYLTTVADRKLLTYKVSNLGLKATSDTLPSDCLCLATRNGQLLAGCRDGSVWRIRNGLDADKLTTATSGVRLLEAFGDLLVGVGDDNSMTVWQFESESRLRQLGRVEFDRTAARLTAVCHPHLYTNKALIGTDSGQLQLWNVRRSKLIYSFGLLESGVSCLSQAPAEDAAAVGLDDGRVVLMNLRLDRRICCFRQDFGRVTGVAFRTDGLPVMLTGSELGHITLWHLEERRVCGQLPVAHSGPVSGLLCPHSQPLLISSSGDNSLKVWLFDRSDNLPRLLHQRSGHSLPITGVEFYNSELITSSLDSSLRSFSLEHDKYNRHFGKCRLNKKDPMPHAVGFHCEPARHGDWCTLVAVHSNSRVATTWDVRKGCQGKRRLQPRQMLADEAKFKDAIATCAHLTLCCNFVLIGYSTGHIVRYNVQSGREAAKRECRPPLAGACIRVHVDARNRVVMATGESGQIAVFAFRTGERIRELSLDTGESPVAGDSHRLSGLVAVATNFNRLLVYQLTPEVKEPLRKLRVPDESNARIGCARFSQDGRWLLASCGNCVTTYSVLHSRRLDTLRCCYGDITAMAMAPAGDVLVTAHRDRLGLQVWLNTTLFRPLPGAESDADADRERRRGVGDSPDGLISLAGLPGSRWRWLHRLDEIRRRNRPTEAPIAPKSAPFFLSVDAVNGGPEAAATSTTTAASSTSALATLSGLSTMLLRAAADSEGEGEGESLVAIVSHLESLGPTAIDSELRDLAEEAYPAFLDCLAACLRRGDHFETSQAYLGLFLKHHGLQLAGVEECATKLKELLELQRRVWRRLESNFQETACLLAYTRDGVLGNVQ